MKNTLLDFLDTEAQRPSGPHGDANHTLHCVDWIRQALMCNADLTLDATDDFHSFGQGSRHSCRNFDAIRDWAQLHGYTGSLDELGKADG